MTKMLVYRCEDCNALKAISKKVARMNMDSETKDLKNVLFVCACSKENKVHELVDREDLEFL